ncbi:hypothetical protein H696_04651 [Fonticula alba]|uniref:Uncharacterized protein n=1 Tax=Fonticula alba TaxID=691883 RepID=A0A058Z4L7_FONAL|nr:hypothetical protein H696_04651 [Fonticula alba]KCV69234.1 hypothetical protein H696_04651 [Fonticula alba]|eukprot:XP_009496805.1 hypothetical protein H696_04651 [Fonticula alba]
MRLPRCQFTDGYSVSSVASSLLNTLAREDTEEIDFAIRYLDLAVERGILSAQLTATQLYSGLADYPCVEGRDRDLPRAVRTGCMAADNGCLTSMFIVCHHFSFGLLRDGGICLDGEGAGEDEDDSTPAGAVRHPAEQVLLFPDWFAASRLYLHYIMLSEDVPATSLAQYLPSMISRLGSMYLAGGHGLLRSIRSAVPFLEMAHRMGDLESTGRLAFIYAFAGYPYIPRDLQRAQVYFSIIRRFDPSFPMPSTQELNAKYRDYKKAMDEKMGISQPASSSSSGKKKSKRPAGTKDGKDATKKDAKGEESSFPWIIPASVAAVAAVSMVVAGLLMSRR